jgi:hypothetical protein
MKRKGKPMLNKKLTPIIAGRTIKSAKLTDAALEIEFEDGSILKIKTGAPFTDTIARRKVKEVRQKATEFDLDFIDGATAKIAMAEETSSVMLRDKAGALEYAD